LLHLADALARHVHQAAHVLERHPVPVAVLAAGDVERAALLHREEVGHHSIECVGGEVQLQRPRLRDVEEEAILARHPGAGAGAVDAVTACDRPARTARIRRPILRGYWEAEGDRSGSQDATRCHPGPSRSRAIYAGDRKSVAESTTFQEDAARHQVTTTVRVVVQESDHTRVLRPLLPGVRAAR